MKTKPILVWDTECYWNFWMVAFRNIETGNVRSFEFYDGHPLDVKSVRKIINSYTLVGFNSNGYDTPMLALALTDGVTNADLKQASDGIIVNGVKPWQFYDRYSCRAFESDEVDSVDLIEVAPGVASLKLYGGRLHSSKLQDLPIEPNTVLTIEQMTALSNYCENDLVTTEDLYRQVLPQLELRTRMSAEFGIDLRSKSDAQIAEVVIKSEVEKLINRKVPKAQDMSGHTFTYKAPKFIWFNSPQLQDVFTRIKMHVFTVQATGSVVLPEWLSKLPIDIGNSTYKMGIGGLHSTEESIAHVVGDDEFLVDRDVRAYYPSLIIGMGLYPTNMGKEFLSVYSKIVERRIEAKRIGDKVTDDALKITINGSFGKFGSKYSILYAPNLLIQTTITGQLALLMLIESLEANGINVVSANTDGVVIKCAKTKATLLESLIYAWEVNSGLETEETPYKAIYSRDVNSYIALKQGGGAKLKGFFAPASIAKNPNNQISTEAVVKYLLSGTPIEETITSCADVRKFLTVRTVRAGAVKNDKYLGRVVRWYYGIGEEGTIRNKVNNYLISRSEGAVPMMELAATLPDDLDHAWYINESKSILNDIGVKHA